MVSKVQVSKRLKDSALIINSPMSSGMRQIMLAMEKDVVNILSTIQELYI